MSTKMDNGSGVKVYATEDYSKFKRLDGNRGVADGRVKKIINSITSIGYMPVPILVNKNFEIIDGQGRVEACKRLGLPVYYIMVDGVGIEECIAMNINQVNWTINDYIKSYADRGNESYQYLLDLNTKFAPDFKQPPVLYAACGFASGGGVREIIKSGGVQISKRQYDKARVALSWLYNVKNVIDKVVGRSEYYYVALLYCYFHKDIDNDRLERKVKAATDIYPVANIGQSLKAIEDIYNYHNSNKVYIETIWRQENDSRISEYNRQYRDRQKRRA